MKADKFWTKIEKVGSGCWLWTASTDTGGYGNVRWGGKNQRAHRIAYELTHGDMPAGVVMHTCDNRRCCNPDHLLLGSHADNMADMVAKGRAAKHAGADNGRAILTPEMVERLRLDTRGTRTIAKDYPVSRSAIQRIKAGRAWAA